MLFRNTLMSNGLHGKRRYMLFSLPACLLGLAAGAAWCRPALGAAKFEPAHGCYIGAFMEKDPIAEGDPQRFAELTGKRHASYFTYVLYGRPFPTGWVEKVKDAGAAPHIAFEPNNGLSVVADDAYLQRWADDAFRAQCPIFLRFASEMNGDWCAYHGDPALYREKFRLVHDVMARRAPNVAMVWTPFAMPQANIMDYYPGDDAVDWVGINIYSVYVHNGDPEQPAADEDPISFLRYIYNLFAARKPIQISEYAATHYCGVLKRDTTEFAVEKMRRFYRTIEEQFPRVKCIDWFSYDALGDNIADNNYSLTSDPKVLAAYRELIAGPYFLSSVPFDKRLYAMRSVGNAETPPSPVTPPGAGMTQHQPLPAPPQIPVWNADADDDWHQIFAHHGGVLSTINTPLLTGLRDGEALQGTVEVGLMLPADLKPMYIRFLVDNVVQKITNNVPYRVLLRPAGMAPGNHVLAAEVINQQGKVISTESLRFRITP